MPHPRPLFDGLIGIGQPRGSGWSRFQCRTTLHNQSVCSSPRGSHQEAADRSLTTFVVAVQQVNDDPSTGGNRLADHLPVGVARIAYGCLPKTDVTWWDEEVSGLRAKLFRFRTDHWGSSGAAELGSLFRRATTAERRCPTQHFEATEPGREPHRPLPSWPCYRQGSPSGRLPIGSFVLRPRGGTEKGEVAIPLGRLVRPFGLHSSPSERRRTWQWPGRACLRQWPEMRLRSS